MVRLESEASGTDSTIVTLKVTLEKGQQSFAAFAWSELEAVSVKLCVEAEASDHPSLLAKATGECWGNRSSLDASLPRIEKMFDVAVNCALHDALKKVAATLRENRVNAQCQVKLERQEEPAAVLGNASQGSRTLLASLAASRPATATSPPQVRLVPEELPDYTGFSDATMVVRAGGVVGGAFGDIKDEEARLGKLTVEYSNGHTESDDPSHTAMRLEASADLILKDHSASRLGWRFAYQRHQLNQGFHFGGGGYETVSRNASLIGYHSVMTGPVVVFGPTTRMPLLALSGFLLGGTSFGGKLVPAPVARKYDSTLAAVAPEAALRAYRGTFGLGLSFLFGRGIVGAEASLSWVVLTTDRQIYRDVPRTSTMLELQLGVFTGVHI